MHSVYCNSKHQKQHASTLSKKSYQKLPFHTASNREILFPTVATVILLSKSGSTSIIIQALLSIKTLYRCYFIFDVTPLFNRLVITKFSGSDWRVSWAVTVSTFPGSYFFYSSMQVWLQFHFQQHYLLWVFCSILANSLFSLFILIKSQMADHGKTRRHHTTHLISVHELVRGTQWLINAD